jgi:L-glyceraldehyde 3-phosphate reductase
MWPGPYGDGGSRKYLLSSLDQSLARMGLDHVDIFYSHRPDPSVPIEETMGALHTAVVSGRALYAGISNYSPAQTREAARVLADLGTPLLIHQPSYSMFNRHIETAQPSPDGGPGESLLDVVGDLGIGTIVFSPLAQGLLTGRYLSGDVPADSRAAVGHFLKPERIDETYLARARALDDVAAGRGQSLAQLALSWVLRDERVTSALIGASSVAQLEDNVAALSAPPLTHDELDAIEPHAVDGTAR